MFEFFTRRRVTDSALTIKPPRLIEGMETVDWSKVRPATGDAFLEKVVSERLRGER